MIDHQPNTSQDIDAAIKHEMVRHDADISYPMQDNESAHCVACGDLWPCQYIIQASITLKLTAIAGILQADQIAIMQGAINGNTSSQGKRR